MQNVILVISLIIPYTDPRLLKNELTDISVSPFTLVFERAGLLSAAAVMNAVVLTTVLSAGNSGLYAATRMLYVLATEGKAPRFFARLSASGVPRRALIAVTAIAALCFLTSIYGKDTVYLILRAYVWVVRPPILVNESLLTNTERAPGNRVAKYRARPQAARRYAA